jgi:hypothetical protein
MPTQLPIACSLDATEFPRRLAEMGDVGRAALVDVTHDEVRADLRFAAGNGIRERIEAIVAAESDCCAFLTMSVEDAPDVVVLTIDAPDGAGPILTALVDAFRGHPQVVS